MQDEEIFAFNCMSDFTAVADALCTPKSKSRAIADSGTSHHFSPDKSKLENYHPLENCHITTAHRSTFRALGIGDVKIDLSNGVSYLTVILKDSVYALDLTFCYISTQKVKMWNFSEQVWILVSKI